MQIAVAPSGGWRWFMRLVPDTEAGALNDNSKKEVWIAVIVTGAGWKTDSGVI